MKKRSKSYRPRLVVNPISRNRVLLEGGVLGALVSLDYGTYTEDNLAEIGAHAQFMLRLAPDGSPAHRQAQSIARIFESTRKVDDKWHLSKLDEATIRAALSVTLEYLDTARNVDIAKASMKTIKEWGKEHA